MSQKNPFFSVVIPLFNKESTIGQTLSAALQQSFDDFEVVVIDDGSTDGSAEIVEELMQSVPKIRLIRQANAHVSAARNRGIIESSGDYVAFLDADDVWERNHLSELHALAKEYPQAGLLGTAYIRRTGMPQGIAVILAEFEGKRGLVNKYFDYIQEAQFIYTSSIAIPRWALDAQGGFPEDDKQFSEDVNLWARMAVHYPLAYSGMATVNYDRTVPGQATSTTQGESRQIGSVFPLSLRSHLENPNISEELKNSVRSYAEHYLFHCCLFFATVGDKHKGKLVREFLSRSEFDQWLVSNCLGCIYKNPDRLKWRIWFKMRLYLRSQTLVRLIGGRLVKNGIILKAVD